MKLLNMFQLDWYGLVAGLLIVDFIPDINIETAKSVLKQHKLQFSVNNISYFYSFVLFVSCLWF